MSEGLSAGEAYDRLAPAYDEYTAENNYEHWLGDVLLPELEKHGLQTGRVLEVGCGTGRAFDPLWRRGWQYWGCDASSEMLRVANAKARPREEGRFSAGCLFKADARDLRDLPAGRADLILALNDVVNYLTEDGDLELFFGGVKRILAPHGRVCFDANSIGVYESEWLMGAGGTMRERGWKWRGLSAALGPGRVYEAEVGAEGVESAVHRQRHWPRDVIEAALASTGLDCRAVLGQRGEDPIVLDAEPDEGAHYKLIYIAGF